MTISELLQLKNRLSEEKRKLDRKISIVNNLINASWFIKDHKSRQRMSDRRIKRETNRQNTTRKNRGQNG